MAQLNSFRDLRVYQELRRLHLAVHEETLRFPKFELYELGSQLRRSSNAVPAILAEGLGSRHTNIYLEAINRSKGELRETQHHLDMAHAKRYFDEHKWAEYDAAYEMCDKMLQRLHQSLSTWRGTTRTGNEVREDHSPYGDDGRDSVWDSVTNITAQVMESFTPPSPFHPPPSPIHLPPSTIHPAPTEHDGYHE